MILIKVWNTEDCSDERVPTKIWRLRSKLWFSCKIMNNQRSPICSFWRWTAHHGLYVVAIIFMTGTKYGCNHRKFIFTEFAKNHSHLTLGRFSTFQAYLSLIEKDCKHIKPVSDLRLQANLVPFETEIASKLGPHCKHIWHQSVL